MTVTMSLSDRLFEKLRRIDRRIGSNFGGKGAEDLAELAGSMNDVPPEERALTPMHRAFYENRGTIAHKWRGYMQHYDQHLSRYRKSPVRFLEIGVFKGGSLQIWRKYFGDNAVIFGIDIDPACKEYDDIAGKVRIGSQDDPNFLMSVVAEMGGIDVVIDDGSHIACHQRASFKILFPKLDSNGVYICEDTHTAYWRGTFEGGYGRPTNFIEIAKKLIDDMHAEFHDHPLSFEDANRTVKGVHFYNSMVVIEKAPQPPSMHLKIS